MQISPCSSIHLERYGTVALSQKGNTCIQTIFTQSPVSLTTTPEYLPVSGFHIPSLHLSQSSRLHPSRFHKTTATIQVAKVIPDLSVTLNNCSNSDQRKKTWKQTHSKVSCFVSKFRSKQFPLPTQFRSFPLTYSTTCSTQTLPQLQFKPRMLPDASEKSRSTFPNRRYLHVISFSVRCQPTVSTPSSTVPSVPWWFLFISLSQHSSTYIARQTTMLQASISRSPVSANIRQAPLFLHITEPQVFNYSRLTSQMWQINQGHWQSKLDPPGSHATISLSHYHLQAWRQAQ